MAAPMSLFLCKKMEHLTHTHTQSLAAAKPSHLLNEPALGCLGTTQTLRASASKWASTPHVEPQGADGVGTRSPSWTSLISETWTAV